MSEPEPGLRYTARPDHPSGIVLMVHGGAEESHEPTRLTQAAVLRMAAVAVTVRRRDPNLVVARLIHRYRGWNDGEQSPVPDLEWAVAEVQRAFGSSLPIGLIGHSMGGRTVAWGAAAPAVRAVVGLAPWLTASDPRETMTGRRLLVVHGTADTETSPVESEAYVASVRPIATSATFISVDGAHHSMLRHRSRFDVLAADFVSATVPLDGPTSPTYERTKNSGVSNLLRRVLDGEPRISV